MTFPTDKFSKVSIDQIVDVRTSDPMRYSRHRSLGSKDPFFEIALTTDLLDYENSEELEAYLDSKLGQFKNFTIQNPKKAIVSRTGLALSASASAGTETITIKNAPANNIRPVAPGDYFTIEGHAKAYRWVSTSPSNGTGIATATFTPPLMYDHDADDAITYGSDVLFQVCLKEYNASSIQAAKEDFKVIDCVLMEQG